MRFRRMLLSALVAALVAAGETAAGTFTASLTATTHTPKVGVPWVWVVTVRDGSGKPLKATAKLRIVFGTAVVGKVGDYSFTGAKRGTITWPARSRGVALKLQATVITASGTKKLLYPFTVR